MARDQRRRRPPPDEGERSSERASATLSYHAGTVHQAPEGFSRVKSLRTREAPREPVGYARTGSELLLFVVDRHVRDFHGLAGDGARRHDLGERCRAGASAWVREEVAFGPRESPAHGHVGNDEESVPRRACPCLGRGPCRWNAGFVPLSRALSAQQTPHRRTARDWRTYWRTRSKVPANDHVRAGLENRFGLLGPTRVQIPPPPLNQTGLSWGPACAQRYAL